MNELGWRVSVIAIVSIGWAGIVAALDLNALQAVAGGGLCGLLTTSALDFLEPWT